MNSSLFVMNLLNNKAHRRWSKNKNIENEFAEKHTIQGSQNDQKYLGGNYTRGVCHLFYTRQKCIGIFNVTYRLKTRMRNLMRNIKSGVYNIYLINAYSAIDLATLGYSAILLGSGGRLKSQLRPQTFI